MNDLINPDEYKIVRVIHESRGVTLHDEGDCPGNATCPVWLAFHRQRLVNDLVQRFATIIGNAKISVSSINGPIRNATAEDMIFGSDGMLWNSVGEIAGELAAINEAVWGSEGPIS